MTLAIQRSRRVFACALAPGILIVSLTVSPAAAQSWRDLGAEPAAPPSVPEQLAGQSLVRVAGPWGSAILHRPQLVDQALDYEMLSEYIPTSSDSPAPARPLSMSDVALIERPASASRTGLVVGAVLGAAAGVALGIGLAQSSTGPSSSFNTGGEAFGGGLAGAMFGCAIGGVVGAVVGSRVPSWRVMYVKPR
jgi:hypothetical protein